MMTVHKQLAANRLNSWKAINFPSKMSSKEQMSTLITLIQHSEKKFWQMSKSSKVNQFKDIHNRKEVSLLQMAWLSLCKT